MSRSIQLPAEGLAKIEIALTSKLRITEYSQEVLREVCDSDGRCLALLHEPYDGSIEDAVRVAEIITTRMYCEFSDASNIQSVMGATDTHGRGRWIIGPNFLSVAEVSTKEASDISGYL